MNAIEVRDVNKCFKIYSDKPLSLKDKILKRGKSTGVKDFWALKDISFEIKPGETVAFIGKNGSGKSTLLKLLSRIIYPTNGNIEINGKVSGLLELGAGFHPDFTGLENIFINGAILGFSEKEIKGKIDEIIEFSEIKEFINSPVRNYSSGMYMRLAFSIAINVQPEIFLVDEILAVGDMAFQRKCIDRINKMKSNGVTIVLVSHEPGAVEKMCDRAIWIHEGNVVADGLASVVAKEYQSFMTGNAERGTGIHA